MQSGDWERHEGRWTLARDENFGMTMLFFWGALQCRGGNPPRGATTGEVMRLRAASGEDGTRGFGFLFFLGGCSGVGGTCGSGSTRGV